MSDQEKKFKLDELPDEGSSSIQPEPAPIKVKEAVKKAVKREDADPRLERLKTLDPVTKVEVMVQKWEFDEPIKSYMWLGFIVVLCVLEFSPIYQTYVGEVQSITKTSATFGELYIENAGLIETIVKHPIIFILLLPFIYRSPKRSEYLFSISFDGIDTVKKILPIGSKELVSRKFIKWKEIERVEKRKVDEKTILRLYSIDDHIGDIIWHIDVTKKKAIMLVLKSLISPKHPIRIFLDNEKELK